MKSIFKFAIVAGVGMTALTSCVNDLNTLPLTQTTVLPEDAWSNPESYELYTAKIYSAFAIPGNDGAGSGDIVGADQGEATFTRSWWNLEELPTDEVKIAWADEGLNGLQFCQWSATNRFIMLNYDRMLLINSFCNEFLSQTTEDKLAGRGLDATKIAAVMVNRAEVRVLRAFSYYILMNFYANPPFVTEDDGIGAFNPKQKTRSELFDWIEEELTKKEVIDNLPEKSANTYGMVNRYVVDMMLANLYMNAEVYGKGPRYSDAAACLKNIIDSNKYSLEPTYKHLFGADNHESAEMIFPIIFDGVYAQCYGGTTYLTAAAYGSDMNAGDNFGLPQSWSGIRAPKDLSELFEDGDSRALFWTTERTQDILSWSTFTEGYSVVKYTNLKKDGTPGSNNTFPDTDFPLYRLADAYLLYVECALRGASGVEVGKAIKCYNDVQERAFGNTNHNITKLDELNLDELLDERARELYWEGHRRTDLIRFNRFIDNKVWTWKNGTHDGTTKINEKYLLYPLPSTDLASNPELKQNDGF